MTGDGDAVVFRPLRRGDFGMVRTWLAEPLVKRWWNHETTAEAVERDFGPSIDGADMTELFVAGTGGRDFGLIQRYPVDDEPEYLAELASVCAVAPGALSIDYLIGDPGSRGRGLGTAMIAAFVARAWREHPAASEVVVPVAKANRASWRALERAGFVRAGEGELEPDNPVDGREHVVYRITRPPAGGEEA